MHGSVDGKFSLSLHFYAVAGYLDLWYDYAKVRFLVYILIIKQEVSLNKLEQYL